MSDFKESDLSVGGPEYYKHVPSDLLGNLEFRKALVRKCARDRDARETHIQACKEDFVYFCMTSVWLFEPRVRRTRKGLQYPQVIPMIPWDHQIPRMRAIRYWLGQRDIGVEKSRAEGVSWIGVLMAAHDLAFEPLCKISIISKDADAVDRADDMDSIMEKIDFTLRNLPLWMIGPKFRGNARKCDWGWSRKTSDSVITNLANGATVTGYAATGDAASGGRAKWVMQDELAKFPPGADKDVMASTQHVTDSRFFVSTPKGATGVFYQLMHTNSNMLRVHFNWEQNSSKNRGLYRFHSGAPKAIDPEKNPLPPEYDPPSPSIIKMFDDLRSRGFKLEGKLRSPWYDNECYRGEATPQNIAQELDRDYGGSSYKIFDSYFHEKARLSVQEPIQVGKVSFDVEAIDASVPHDPSFEQPSIVSSDNGPLKLWVPLSSDGKPPLGSYAIGADVATGLGGTFSSASTICVFNTQTSEQVAEWSDRHTAPARFAEILVALSKVFHNAFLSWEVEGPGRGVSRRIKMLRYSNVYHRSSQRNEKTAGWSTNTGTKESMFSDFENAVKTRKVAIRSDSLLKECGNYIRKNGKIHHSLVPNADDDAEGVSHGDLAIAACVAYQAMVERPRMSDPEMQLRAMQSAEPGSFASRNMQTSEFAVEEADGWELV